ncbi:hypothetical protein LJC42_00335 [Eubacteriales bacterium OttesenSCG-928-K08]|nr:hypothetical protein [Eubacteriales bacterium OttesenSCG-928-K08]
MIKAARQGWTEQEILDRIHAASGTKEVRFRFDVLRNGATVRSVQASGSITLNRFANIQRTAQFVLHEELDWLNEMLMPYMLIRMDAPQTPPAFALTWDERDAMDLSWDEWDALNYAWNTMDNAPVPTGCHDIGAWDDREKLNLMWQEWDDLDLTWDELDRGILCFSNQTEYWAEFPLGLFILSSPKRDSKNGLNTWTVSAYDRTVILAEDGITQPWYIPVGTAYMDAIQTLLISAGIDAVIVDGESDAVLKTAREFDPGTSKRSIINTLLSEINWNSIYCNADGIFVLSPYTVPSESDVSYIYRVDELSIISRDTASEADYYNVPNVFLAIVSNPELEEDYTATWENHDPLSPLSIENRGRRIVTNPPYQPESTSSQAALDAYVERLAFEANQIYEKLSISTAINPLHERADVIEIKDHPDDINGVWVESSWAINLSHEDKMTHNFRRLVTI